MTTLKRSAAAAKRWRARERRKSVGGKVGRREGERRDTQVFNNGRKWCKKTAQGVKLIHFRTTFGRRESVQGNLESS